MLDGTALEAIRDDALWIVLIIVVGLLVLRFARALSAGEQWAATGELRRRLLAAFAENGIELPMRNLVVEQPAQ